MVTIFSLKSAEGYKGQSKLPSGERILVYQDNGWSYAHLYSGPWYSLEFKRNLGFSSAEPKSYLARLTQEFLQHRMPTGIKEKPTASTENTTHTYRSGRRHRSREDMQKESRRANRKR